MAVDERSDKGGMEMSYCQKCDCHIDDGQEWEVKLIEPLLDPRPGRTFYLGGVLPVCEACSREMVEEKSAVLV